MEPGKPERRFRRTEKIVLGVAMSALIVSGCSDESVQERRCVDRTGQVTQSYNCDDDETRRYYGSSGGGVYSWYFGGSGYSVGETVSGGSRTPPRGYSAPVRMGKSGSSLSGAHYASASGTSRGGFGSSAASHGSSGS